MIDVAPEKLGIVALDYEQRQTRRLVLVVPMNDCLISLEY